MQLAELSCLVSLITLVWGVQNGKTAPWLSAINKNKHARGVFATYSSVLLCIYGSLDYAVKGNTQIWKKLYQKIQTGKKTTKKFALPGLVVATLITETTGSLQNIWDLLKPRHSTCSQPISSDVQNAAALCYYTTQNHMKHRLLHRFINKMSTTKETSGMLRLWIPARGT